MQQRSRGAVYPITSLNFPHSFCARVLSLLSKSSRESEFRVKCSSSQQSECAHPYEACLQVLKILAVKVSIL